MDDERENARIPGPDGWPMGDEEGERPGGGGEQRGPDGPSGGLTRRRFLTTAAGAAGGLVALGLAGFGGYEWPRATRRAASPPKPVVEPEVRTFLSRPDLQPPAVTITRRPRSQASSPRYIVLAPKGYQSPGPGQAGLMILDRRGSLVWFQPVKGVAAMDFDAQSYRGQPVLTWWEGMVKDGIGFGAGKIADSSYRGIETIHGGHGLQADLHELNLTSAGTVLVTAYELVTADLSAVGGPSRGKVFTGHALEVDPATGKVLFDWNSLDHVGVEESHLPAPHSPKVPFDYFHINSIGETPDGNLLISARNTWALYKVDRSTGAILWRMNGKRSDFTMGPGASFYWQHHARAHGPDTLTLFDDGGSPPEEKQSRALLLSVDTKAMHTSLRHAYVHPAGFIAANQGSVQLLPDGRVFVGWGNQPYFSEFAPDGTILLDGELPANIQSYRAFTTDWVGYPTEPPRIAVKPNPSGEFIVYATWNGATEVERWAVLGGKTATSLSLAGSQERSGFETAVAVNAEGPYFAVTALDRRGRKLGSSSVVKAATHGVTTG